MKKDISKNLKQMDLNLLVTFQALMQSRSVKQAAEELFLSDSAVSRALGRLRTTFNDELFTRTHTGMIPTEKARSLEAQLSNVLSDIDHMLDDKQFDLFTCDESFVISSPALISCDLIPELMQVIQHDAPKVSVFEVPPQANPYPSLDKGEIDFAIHNFPSFDKNYYCELLGKASTALYVSSEHPALKLRNLKLSDLSEYPVIGNLVEVGDHTGFESPITQYCEKFSNSKTASLRSVQLHTLIRTTELTDSVFLASKNLEPILSKNTKLSKLDLEDFAQTSIDFYLISLSGKVQSESYQWLIKLLKEKYEKTFCDR